MEVLSSVFSCAKYIPFLARVNPKRSTDFTPNGFTERAQNSPAPRTPQPKRASGKPLTLSGIMPVKWQAVSSWEKCRMKVGHRMLAERTVLVVLAVVLVFAVWVLISPHEVSRIDMNHRRAYERIKELTTAERIYAARYEDGYACELAKLGATGLVNAVLASGTQAGYRFELHCTQRTGQTITDYTVMAEPVSPGTTGDGLKPSQAFWTSPAVLLAKALDDLLAGGQLIPAAAAFFR
jgi:hypothetical protein